MGYLKLRNGNIEASLRTLRAAKFNFEGDGEKDVDGSSVYLYGWEYDDTLRTFSTMDTVQLGKSIVLVTPNPKIGEILGSQPACPVTISPGYYGSIDVGLGSNASEEAISMIQEQLTGAEGWLVKCTYLFS